MELEWEWMLEDGEWVWYRLDEGDDEGDDNGREEKLRGANGCTEGKPFFRNIRGSTNSSKSESDSEVLNP